MKICLRADFFFMTNKIKELKFNQETVQFFYRGDDDMSVIEEFFVDKMYRSTESLIQKTNNPILDIGAHIGCFSVYARKLNSVSPIIAIEPEPNNFELLKENLKINHCKDVITKQVALVSQSHPERIRRLGEEVEGSFTPRDLSTSFTPIVVHSAQDDVKKTTLYLNKDSHNHSTFYETKESISVSALNLEELIKKNKLEKIGILKIDIEGEEFSVIKNIKPDTWKLIENIILEYHDFRGNDHNDLENIIHSKGFSIEHFPNYYDKRFGLLICRNKAVHSS